MLHLHTVLLEMNMGMRSAQLRIPIRLACIWRAAKSPPGVPCALVPPLWQTYPNFPSPPPYPNFPSPGGRLLGYAEYPELLWNPGTINTFEVPCILAVDLIDLNRFIVLFCCAQAGQHLGASSWGRGSLSLNYLFSFRRFYLCITLNCYGTQGRSALLRLHVS